jgi:cysteinyl-tRNA synthetase
VTIYNCGPTIYDHFHIGNARNFVVMDVVRRYFEWLGYEVRFVQNLTDIEDKIIKKAKEEGVSTEAITEKYKAAYFEDAGKLGIREADEHPRATEYVREMVEFMQALEAKGLAYERNGSVYFRVRAFDGYGKLSGRSVDAMLEGARVEVAEEKDDPLDFVLWKAAKPGEPTWDSPWGKGRPGWHSECAVMARRTAGRDDRHSFGRDGPDVPASRERDCAARGAVREAVRAVLDAQRVSEYRQREDEQVAGEFFQDRRGAGGGAFAGGGEVLPAVGGVSQSAGLQ